MRRPDDTSPPRARPTGRVLVVDDLAENIALIQTILQRDGYDVRTARNGGEALEAIALDPPDIVLSDVMMPEVDGFELCRRVKADKATTLLPVVLLTGLQDTESRIRGISIGADDFISKPFEAQELRVRVRSLIRIKRYTDDLESAQSVIISLALTIEARDRATDGHCQRLAAYAAVLGERLGMGDDDIAVLKLGGFLHDLGKVGVPDAVLLKPGRLTAEEFEVIKGHTLIGDRLCGELRSLKRVRPIVRGHHERRDGSGYPDGLRGDDIALSAQIIGVVDVFDALIHARPYKPAWSREHAYQELILEAERGWRRRDLVDLFIEVDRAAGSSGLAPRRLTFERTGDSR